MWDAGDTARALTGIKGTAVVFKGWCLLLCVWNKSNKVDFYSKRWAKEIKIKGRSEHKEDERNLDYWGESNRIKENTQETSVSAATKNENRALRGRKLIADFVCNIIGTRFQSFSIKNR